MKCARANSLSEDSFLMRYRLRNQRSFLWISCRLLGWVVYVLSTFSWRTSSWYVSFHELGSADEKLVARCEFNKPFDSLRVFPRTAADYMKEVGFASPSVVWFDFEAAISEDLRSDSVDLAIGVRPGSFVFITATAELPGHLKDIKGLPKRLSRITDQLGATALLMADDLNATAFPAVAARILVAFLQFGFAGRSDGKFFPFLRVNYRDSTWMVTVGGYFGDEESIEAVRQSLSRRMPLLRPLQSDFVFQIEQFNITDAERKLFDRAALSRKGRRSELMAVRKLGFRPSIIEQYQHVMRFIPRYFESLL